MRTRFFLPTLFASLVARLVVTPAAYSQESPQERARRILDATGVKGGLIVHVGCGDGRLTAALRAGAGFLVQGLDADADHVRQARQHVDPLGVYGQVAVDRFDGRTLPYVDNLVNLLVVENPDALSRREIMRVLCPQGVAYLREEGQWTRTIKPWPDEIDEWTHYLYDAGGNAASRDRVVGPPRHFQWIASPRFSRSHDHLASVSVSVSAGGRVFSVIDMGSIAFAAARPRWRLVAHDAFSGVPLWQREIPKWEYHLRDFRSGPAELARRLVAVGERVYVTLGYGEPTSCLDAATGETIRVYPGTEGTQEILYCQGRLFLVLGEPDRNWKVEEAKRIVSQIHYLPAFERVSPPAHNKKLVAVDAVSGAILWQRAEADVRNLMPSTLAVDGGRVFFQNPEAIACLDAATGQPEWQCPRPVQRQRLAWSTPTLVAHEGTVYAADRKAADPAGELLWLPSGGYHTYIQGNVQGELWALDAVTGRRLWSCPAWEGFNAPVDILITGGRLWTGRYAWGQDPGITEGRDPKTGEVVQRRPPDQEYMKGIGHARCFRARATAKYLVLGRRGVECVDVQTGDMTANLFVRGICQFGFLPANGLLYIPPHSCACSVSDLIKDGFLALAPERADDEEIEPASEAALERGPAFGFEPSDDTIADQQAWPTYRHDAGRSGATPAAVPCRLQVAWKTSLGGSLTSPVVAQNVLLVGQTDAHRVQALDATTGQRLWTCVTGARIDSPPTIDRGLVLFGSHDGSVYGLRLADGELIWRFHAAPGNRQIVVNGQLESIWPVSGSVLVLDGSAYFAAGRTSYLDGGIFLYKLDVATGRLLKAVQLEVEKAQRDRGVVSGGYLPDVLSASDGSIFMRVARFDQDLVRQKNDVPHLWSSVGFLDDSWWHRTYWQFGTSMGNGWGGWPKTGQIVPAGRLLATDGVRIAGFGRNQYDIPGAHVGVDGDGAWGPVGQGLDRWTFYRLFAGTLATPQEGQNVAPAPTQKGKGRKARTREGRSASASGPRATSPSAPDGWSHPIPVLAQALLLANDTLFVAGPLDPLDHVAHEPAEADPLAAARQSTRGGRLLALSLADGKMMTEEPLESPPVFDGMAAAEGRLYLASKAGEIICFGGK